MYAGGFTELDIEDHVTAVHNNTIQSMETLYRQSQVLADEKPECAVMNAENHNYGRIVCDASEVGTTLNLQLVEAVESLWKDKGIKNTFHNRSRFQLPASSADYFFEHCREYIVEGWKPNKQDMLHCRVRTTGIMECMLRYEGFTIKVVDVGGQRSERKKWINCFENVQAVLFVVAISEYDQTLFEDDSINRMTEALNIFADICNNRFFQNSSMILFLNKRDLFQEKIPKIPLTVCFKDYLGLPGDTEAAWKYIRDRFLELSEDPKKEIYVHLTCATDDSSVKAVFDASRDIVIRKALESSGLVV